MEGVFVPKWSDGGGVRALGQFPCIAGYVDILSRFAWKISRFYGSREFRYKYLTKLDYFWKSRPLECRIAKFPGYFPGSREFVR